MTIWLDKLQWTLDILDNSSWKMFAYLFTFRKTNEIAIEILVKLAEQLVCCWQSRTISIEICVYAPVRSTGNVTHHVVNSIRSSWLNNKRKNVLKNEIRDKFCFVNCSVLKACCTVEEIPCDILRACAASFAEKARQLCTMLRSYYYDL